LKGYFGNPEATKEVFTDDGFLKTGDLGRFDTKGYLFITGRNQSLIVTAGGKNIYPEEIEQKFEGSRRIQEILVLGERRGEEKTWLPPATRTTMR
jgi:long-chain acyl-CoA synthetase